MVSEKDLLRIRKQGVEAHVIDPQRNWIQGSFKGLDFQAMIFEKPSKFGIRQGKTSKLGVKRSGSAEGWIVASFDRGWDIVPKTKVARELVTILALKKQRRR